MQDLAGQDSPDAEAALVGWLVFVLFLDRVQPIGHDAMADYATFEQDVHSPAVVRCGPGTVSTGFGNFTLDSLRYPPWEFRCFERLPCWFGSEIHRCSRDKR